MYYTTEYDSPIGKLTIAIDDAGALCGLWRMGQKHFGGNIKQCLTPSDDTAKFAGVIEWLDAYFNGNRPTISEINITTHGTDFQTRVWRELTLIPFGETRTYGDIAHKLNTSARAVGGAVGRNPILIIIPCHRVIGANNQITGYAAGCDIKKHLLRFEQQASQS